MLRLRKVLCYLTIGLLIIGIFIGEAEARRKVLVGRKVITRQYYKGTSLPAWTIALFCGIGILIIGGGSFVGLKKYLVDSIDLQEGPSYQPAQSDEV